VLRAEISYCCTLEGSTAVVFFLNSALPEDFLETGFDDFCVFRVVAVDGGASDEDVGLLGDFSGLWVSDLGDFLLPGFCVLGPSLGLECFWILFDILAILLSIMALLIYF